MKRYTMLCCIFVLVLVTVGCRQETKLPDDGFHAAMGETLSTSFLDFSVESVQLREESIQAELDGEEDLVLSSGEKFLVVTVSATNTTRRNITLYFDDFELEWGDTKRFPEFPITAAQLEDGRLASPNREVQGEVIFIVPDNLKEAYLVLDEYFDGDVKGDTYKVLLTL